MYTSKPEQVKKMKWQQRLADFHKVTRESEDTLAQNSKNRSVDKAQAPVLNSDSVFLDGQSSSCN